jgi:hypothetical protein
MAIDPIRGKTIRWTYDDGPMKGKSFEHTFGQDGMVTWRQAGGKAGADSSAKYQAIPINDEVHVVSYLAASGYTLTSVLDFATGTVVSFASNEKELVPQRGMFEVAERVR